MEITLQKFLDMTMQVLPLNWPDEFIARIFVITNWLACIVTFIIYDPMKRIGGKSIAGYIWSMLRYKNIEKKK